MSDVPPPPPKTTPRPPLSGVSAPIVTKEQMQTIFKVVIGCFVAFMFFSCLGVFLAEENPTVLSERFWPHNSGSSSVETTYLYMPESGCDGRFWKDKVVYENDGIIRKNTIELRALHKRAIAGYDKSGEADVSGLREVIEHYRIHDGFVEIGSQDEFSGEMFWAKKLKIGAEVGDRWESLGSEYEFTKLDGIYATIESRSTMFGGGETTTLLRLDFGPFDETVYVKGEKLQNTMTSEN